MIVDAIVAVVVWAAIILVIAFVVVGLVTLFYNSLN